MRFSIIVDRNNRNRVVVLISQSLKCQTISMLEKCCRRKTGFTFFLVIEESNSDSRSDVNLVGMESFAHAALEDFIITSLIYLSAAK